MNKNNIQISASGSERPYARTVCKTCMHHCNLAPGQSGICGARKNENGTIVCANYGKITALALDPIEKKPLHVTRFFPRYHMTEKDATDVQQVYWLANLAGKYVQHVFVGNC